MCYPECVGGMETSSKIRQAEPVDFIRTWLVSTCCCDRNQDVDALATCLRKPRSLLLEMSIRINCSHAGAIDKHKRWSTSACPPSPQTGKACPQQVPRQPFATLLLVIHPSSMVADPTSPDMAQIRYPWIGLRRPS